MQNQQIVKYPEPKVPLVIGDKIFRSANDFEVTAKDLQKAHRNLGETESIREASLRKLKQMLYGDDDAVYRTEDSYLLRYLRQQKFDCDKAYKIIRRIYSLRTKRPEFFSIAPNFEYIMKSNLVKYLPYRNEEGNCLLWFDFRVFKTMEFTLDDLVQMINAFGDLYTLNPGFQIHGIIELWDFRGLTARHVAKILSPTTLLTLNEFLLGIYPWRIKRIVGIYTNKLIQSAYYLIRPIIKKKIADRIILLGSDLSELHKYVDPAILPKEYGGNIEEGECNMHEFFIENTPYMKYEHSFRTLS